MADVIGGPLGEPIYDFVVLAIPVDVDPEAPGFRKKINDEAHRNIYAQYKNGFPKAIVVDPIEWLITSDWRDVEVFQPAHDCPTCNAGNAQAIAFLKEHPERRLALGNLKYAEVW